MLVTGNDEDVLDPVPLCRCDDDPQSEVRVINVIQNDLSNALHRELPDIEGRKTVVPTSQETFADRTLTPSHSEQATVSNKKKKFLLFQ